MVKYSQVLSLDQFEQTDGIDLFHQSLPTQKSQTQKKRVFSKFSVTYWSVTKKSDSEIHENPSVLGTVTIDLGLHTTQ
jgi:hypothetical protein